MSRRTGNNYSGPRWAFSSGRPNPADGVTPEPRTGGPASYQSSEGGSKTRREAVRDMLAKRYHGAIEITDEMVDAVVAGL